MPDFASSVDNIQIQRGAGTSTNGAAAFGATVAMQTQKSELKPYAEYSVSAGSFWDSQEHLVAVSEPGFYRTISFSMPAIPISRATDTSTGPRPTCTLTLLRRLTTETTH
ncbi:MAG: hypothetical protein ACLR6J_06100 [Parabacteroides merdae]